MSGGTRFLLDINTYIYVLKTAGLLWIDWGQELWHRALADILVNFSDLWFRTSQKKGFLCPNKKKVVLGFLISNFFITKMFWISIHTKNGRTINHLVTKTLTKAFGRYLGKLQWPWISDESRQKGFLCLSFSWFPPLRVQSPTFLRFPEVGDFRQKHESLLCNWKRKKI